jgi:hypothetical protein
MYVLKCTIRATARTFRVMFAFRFSIQSLRRALTSEMWRIVLRKKLTGFSEERASSTSACHLLLPSYLVGLFPDDGSRIFRETSDYTASHPRRQYSLLCYVYKDTGLDSLHARRHSHVYPCYCRVYVSTTALSRIWPLLPKCRRWNQSIRIRPTVELITITD